MPAPGDDVPQGMERLTQLATDTAHRDGLIARMFQATPNPGVFTTIPGGPPPSELMFRNTRFEPGSVKEGRIETQPVPSVSGAITSSKLILAPKSGDVLGVLDTPLRALVEQALLPYTDIVTQATPDNRWRAAEHFRPYWAIGALVDVIRPLVKPLAAYTDQELEAEMERRK